MIPKSSFLSFITGNPDTLYFLIKSTASWSTEFTFNVIGFVIIPLSERLTLWTSSAWRSIVIFLCIKPIPPTLARLIASLDSVTVSIAALSIGTFSTISFVRLVFKLTSLGTTLDACGISNTSSNVNPSAIILLNFLLLTSLLYSWY